MCPLKEFNPEGIAKGRRIIVGGSSPHLLTLPSAFLKTGLVIGVNKWPVQYACDYWLCADTRIIYEKAFDYWEAAHRHQAVKLFSRSGNIRNLPPWFTDVWFDECEDLPKRWHEKLCFKYSSAVSAVHLAWLMQPDEIVLYGIDFVGQTRYDGGYSWCWNECVTEISEIFEQLAKTIPIYKLNKKSALNLPLMTL